MPPSKEELLVALDKADAAGDTEAAQHFSGLLKAIPVAKPVAPEAPEETSFLGDFGRGAIASAANIGQTLLKPVGWISPTAREYLGRSKKISDQMKEESGLPGALGGLAVDIAGTGGISGLAKTGLTKAATYLPMASRAARAATAAPTIAATEGALSGAYLSPDDPLSGAGYGAVGGAAGQQILSRTLGRVAKPVDLNKFSDTEALMHQGVPMTVGLGANPNTAVGRGIRLLEETLSAAPFVGSSIRNQRETARMAWRDMPLREAASKAGVAAPTRAGYATHSQLQDQVATSMGAKYDALLAGKSLRPTAVLSRNLDDIVQNPKLSMVANDRKRARDLIEAHVNGRRVDYSVTPPMAPSMVKAEDIFKAQSDLRKLGNDAMRSQLSSERAYGHALVDAADEIYNFIGRRFPNIGAELQSMRAPYAELSTLRSAAAKAGARGEFSPAQLGKTASIRGNDPLKQWAAMAEPLLTKDPGNVSNLARLSLLTGGGILMGTGALPVAAAASLLFGTRTGQRALQGGLGWQKKLGEVLANNPELVSHLTGMAGRETALGMRDQQQE